MRWMIIRYEINAKIIAIKFAKFTNEYYICGVLSDEWTDFI